MFDWGDAVLSLGADDVLVKPFDPPQLLSVIQNLLDRQSDSGGNTPSLTKAALRKYTRFSVHLSVSFGEGTIEHTGIVLDISPEGCRTRCPDAAPDLQYFQVQIGLPEMQTKLCVDLAVRRWSKNEELGVEFIRMEPDNQTRLGSLIRTLEEAGAGQQEQQGPGSNK